MLTERMRHGMQGLVAVAVAAVCWLGAPPAQAVRERKGDAGGAAVSDPGALEARRLLARAKDLMEAKETERAVRIYESILEQYPGTPSVFPASLELGRYYLEQRDQNKAVPLLARLKALEQPDKELKGDEQDWFLEALYLTGVAHFQSRRFGEAFSVLRKITSKYSGTVWANQAYYYIGMCHFAQSNWAKAIEALNMVGAFADPSSPAAEYIEAGRRFYARIEDRDLPLLARLGKKPRVVVETSRGDREQVETIPLTADGKVVGSLSTVVAVPKPGDGVLQVLCGDTITTTYTDEGTESGTANVARTSTVKVVSTGALSFMLGDHESAAVAAYVDDWSFVRLLDSDLDVSDGADTAEVTVVSRYKKVSDSEAITSRAADQAVEYVTRDEVRVILKEMGTNAPLRSGRFSGKFRVAGLAQKDSPVSGDDVLSCREGDEVVATYTDALNIDGPVPRTASASLPVLGHVDSRPRASQDFVNDPVVLAKKNLVEASAYLELARIFRSMGLMKGAREKVAAGLDRSLAIVRLADLVPPDLRQEAFKVTWELHIAADDFSAAMTVCSTFNKLYPDSPIVDEALMGIGRIHMENQEYPQAIAMFNQVLALQKSEAKGEAQFRIGEAAELAAEKDYQEKLKAGVRKLVTDPALRRAGAIPAYKLCADRYPESSYAPQAVAKVIDFYVDTKDFAQAGTMLEQVFTDYPDASFLDSMYLKWTLVAYQSGDYVKAREKCQALISEYPDSAYAQKAKDILPKIQAKVDNMAGGAAAAGGAGGADGAAD